ncbi:14982_t:CDS:1, partial [Funneliformis geosporum]
GSDITNNTEYNQLNITNLDQRNQEDNILQDTTKNSNDNNVSDITSIMEISKTKDAQDKTTKPRYKKLKTNSDASDT